MEIDEVFVKDNPGLCRCCLSEGCYKDLASNYAWMGDTEIYADMLLECFDISISQQVEGPNGLTRLICEVCITRLRDACNFKKQVVESENKFIDMIGRGEFRQKVYETSITKQELTFETEETDGTEPEYLHGADYTEPDEDDEVLANLATTSRPQETPKRSRGRPKKTTGKTTPSKTKVKAEKKKVVKEEGKKARGVQPETLLSSTKRNRLIRKNVAIILENSTALPFKWHRQSYVCFYCHKLFKNTTSLKEHTIQHGVTKVTSALSYLRGDERTKINISDLKCRLCGTISLGLQELVLHLKLEHKKIFTELDYGVIPYNLEGAFKCAVCMEEFEYFVKLNQHMNAHFSRCVCESCGKSFLSKDRLRIHLLTHGTGFSCTTCSEIFDTAFLRAQHEKKSHQTKLIKCTYCTLTFKNYNERKRHHNIAHGVKIPVYKCKECEKTFNIMSKMKAHIQAVHRKERNFQCSVCTQKFFSKTHVRKHMIKHYGDRIHQCEVCKKAYARKQTLKDHMRTHKSDKGYVCDVCSQAFVQSNSLKLHLRLHHIEGSCETGEN